MTNSMERTFAIESVPNWEDGDVRVYLSGLSSLLEVRDEYFFFSTTPFSCISCAIQNGPESTG